MATQEHQIFLDPSTGASAAFVYDDVTLTVSGLHAISGTTNLTAFVVHNGTTLSRTLAPGNDVVVPLPSSAVTMGTNARGQQTFTVNGVDSYGFTVSS